jgi:hypothetical protein
MAEAIVAYNGHIQKDAYGESQKPEEEASIHSAGISADDAKEIEAHIAELTRQHHIVMGSDMGKPIKKEMVFPIVANLSLFSIAAVVLIFFTRYSGQQESSVKRSSAFSSVEGELLSQLKEDSESIISGKEQEITTIRRELTTLELQRQEELAAFDAQLALREAMFREQMIREFEAEQAYFEAEGLSQAEIDERLRNLEQERLAQYQRQLADERSAIQQNFDQRERQYQDNIRALNDERRTVQAAIQQQEGMLRLSQEQSAADRQALEQAMADMQRMSEMQQHAANEEAIIVGMFNKIQGDFQAEQFETAITDADNLTRILQNMPNASTRRDADIALAGSLARMARLEMENQRLTRSDLAAVALSAEQQAALEGANLRISELQAAFDEANRQFAEREAAFEEASLRSAAELEETRIQYARNLANATTMQRLEYDEALATLKGENERLRQQNQQLTGGAAGQSAAASQLQARIRQLETENERLRQQTGAASTQLSSLQSRMNQLETENNKLKESEQTLTYNLSAMTNNYNSIKPASDAYAALIRAYSVYKNDPERLSNLERFLNERGVSTVFPGLAEKVRNITDSLTVAARKEALSTVSSILETTLRIRAVSTRKLYLESMKVRYISDPVIVDFVDLLIKRL